MNEFIEHWVSYNKGDDAMGNFEGQRLGLREVGTNRLIIAYPFTATGSDELIKKRVKTWYYLVTCSGEYLCRLSERRRN